MNLPNPNIPYQRWEARGKHWSLTAGMEAIILTCILPTQAQIQYTFDREEFQEFFEGLWKGAVDLGIIGRGQ